MIDVIAETCKKKSHSLKDFISLQIWELGYPTKVKHNAKMLLLAGWNLTQFSTFNKSDTYLCVCGVQIVGEYFPSPYGRGAVFRTSGKYTFRTDKMFLLPHNDPI